MKKSLLYLLLFIAFVSCSQWTPAVSKSGYTPVKEGKHAKSESIIAPYRDSLSRTMKEVIGYCSNALITKKPQGSLGNFVCDLLLEDIPAIASYQFLKEHNYFSLLNTRGFRAPLPEGEVTVERIFSIMPFENEVVLVRMPIKELPTIGSSLVEKGGHPLSKNTSLVSFSGEFAGLHISDLKPAANMWIITTDYLAEGGDNMEFFAKAEEVISTHLKLRDVIIAHIRKLTSQGKSIQAETDDRILFFR
ncbi:MAG TPA: hypothetical protein DEP18_04285 [Flavobacteriales bacterium]|nr:hypothetical protein [Flavobacteriales bacterium]HRE75898.1 5'-nucleotidase [Flavobacteriales bacterium]HRE96446.1 5'-nucleotidase [Flavobacteriales bacterium]HRJ37026.1 5'-nucleotidase [Flavobacteriales bacterium]HRJ40088.1 5'-nucleotidase [Flavobacteriales bacterium]